MTQSALLSLQHLLDGDLHFDEAHLISYATDASAYREIPIAVAFPKNENDIQALIRFARENDIGLIPRTAGTSLAGQVVGKGIIVDVSKHFTSIIEFNKEDHTVTVQPGVIRDELNTWLKEYGRLFGPETSTANRAMIGGMVGNNSCGSNSVMYGSTRDHLLRVEGFLADGTKVVFEPLNESDFNDKVQGKTTKSNLEQDLYKHAQSILGNAENQKKITSAFPHPDIPRRNTGFALDLLMDAHPLNASSSNLFNFCKLIAGSEGTLFFITEITLKTVPIPPPIQGLLCVHFQNLYESLESTIIALEESPGAVELMDNYILDCTKTSAEHKANRFFLEGEPEALLVIQLLDHSKEAVDKRAIRLTEKLKSKGFGYAFPLLHGTDCEKVWQLRKAGLGLLSNIPGDAKPAPVIEDTAVRVEDLPRYIKDFNKILEKHKLECVHYAHAGSGELHLRPILNLKTERGNQLFREILSEIAELVKRYKGSLSGEHGDGRLRGEFIPYMVGAEVYKLFEELKDTWDPNGIFNPGKIVRTPPMNTGLRYTPGQQTFDFPTSLDFSKEQGLLRTAELCNGSGDCRKTELTGGVMCPTYMASKNEVHTTRARANLVREHITQKQESERFNHDYALASLDHCISCKGCKKECPSSVDMAKIKSEFEHQHHQKYGTPFSTKLIGNFTSIMRFVRPVAPIFNAINTSAFGKTLLKTFVGFSKERSLPKIQSQSLKAYCSTKQLEATSNPSVLLYVDEFTDLNDTHIGIATVNLLDKLGISFALVSPKESGRTYLSKGMLTEAVSCAKQNVETLSNLVNKDQPLVGIEPSAILTFRDEYPDLLRAELKEKAKILAQHTFTIEEYLSLLIDENLLNTEQFHDEPRDILIHGHCHQKALSSESHTRKILSLPKNYNARLIPSGCCGMAGSFGYMDKHYKLSMQIGETTLFPAIRKSNPDQLLAASGTSCRHQIVDGTSREVMHPVEILLKAIK